MGIFNFLKYYKKCFGLESLCMNIFIWNCSLVDDGSSYDLWEIVRYFGDLFYKG